MLSRFVADSRDFIGLQLTISGKIFCKFPNGSSELRYLGSFLKLHQIHETFQPYIRIREENHLPTQIVIEPEVIERMCTHACFEMGSFSVNVSPKHGAINIELALWDITQREDLLPISGFPRNLVLEGQGEGERKPRYKFGNILLTALK